MRPRIYELEVGAGCLLAILLAFLRGRMPDHAEPALSGLLEAASFGLSCLGTMAGGRSVRARYEALGRNKDLARRNPDYMQQRRRMQWAAAMAGASTWSLIAGRTGISPLTALPLLAGLAILFPITNRATGWSSAATPE